ncbi:MAG: sensor histidine kinase [Candidatus Omnitrophica bacterium]|nr:sensor histidine kinase [Candidatus Omnitrophota bacterium]
MEITDQQWKEPDGRQLLACFLHAQDEDRRRLARQLHDTTVQALTALRLKLGLLLDSQLANLESTGEKLLRDSIRLTELCADQIRTLTNMLHSPILDELGLVGALHEHVDFFTRQSGIKVKLELMPGIDRLPAEVELALFRILQECLTNIHRHSGSRTASVRLERNLDEVRLEVRDSGSGMCLAVSEPGSGPGAGKTGIGIASMRQRTSQLGGRLEVSSCPGNTVVRTIIPLETTGNGRNRPTPTC